MLWSASHGIGTIELTGLPGVGKSTVCDALARRLGPGHVSLVGRRRRLLRKSRLYWLFLPLALLRFRAVIGSLWSGADAGEAGKAGAGAADRPRGTRPLAWKVLRKLALVEAEIHLAELEALLRRKLLVFDEGLVHCGVWIFLRVPPARREAIWRAYVDCLPARRACLLLDCPPAEAAARAADRPRGVPRSIDPDGSAGSTELEGRYEELAALLHGKRLGSRVRMLEIDGRPSPDEVAGSVIAELDRRAGTGDLLLFSRS